MDRKLRNKWVKALRSGKYKQGKEHLRQENDKGKSVYCCLGVLIEVAGGDCDDDAYAFDNATLAADFEKKIDLAKNQTEDLAHYNDGDREDGSLVKSWSFKRIATWIEKNL